MNRIKEISKLINSGYPLYIGIGFLGLTTYHVVKFIISLINGSTFSTGILIGIGVILIIGSGLGILLIKIGIDAKKE